MTRRLFVLEAGTSKLKVPVVLLAVDSCWMAVMRIPDGAVPPLADLNAIATDA